LARISENSHVMETKDRILKGAEELFFRFGIKSITMDDIARHLGMSKKTIYLFFADKDEVVHTLMKTQLEEDRREFQEVSDKAANFVEEVFGHMKKLGTIIEKVNPSIFYDLQKFYPASWKLFRDFKEECICKMVEESLEKGKKQGLVRQDVNTRIMARLRIEEIEMGFSPDKFPPEKFRILEVQLALIEHFLYGICTLKGHKLINKYKQVVEDE
jgi:TetR/AcrR family transcriptional regulator, cholesterol catabolism regulator